MRARMFLVCLVAFAFAVGCAQKNFVLADVPIAPDLSTAAAPSAVFSPLAAEAPPPDSDHGYLPIFGGVRMSLLNFARDSQFNPTGMMQMFAFFKASKFLVFEGTLGFTVPSADTDDDNVFRGLHDGSFFMMPLTFGAYLNFPVAVSMESGKSKSLVDLYVGGGAGMYLIDFEVSAKTVHDFEAIGHRYFDEWVDGTFGVHLGGGLNISLNEQAAINVDLRYAMGKAQTHYQAFNVASGLWWRDDDWVDIHHLQVGIGLCVEF